MEAGKSMMLPWECHGASTGLPQDFHGASVGVPWKNFHGDFNDFPWESHGTSMQFYFSIPMEHPRDFYGASM